MVILLLELTIAFLKLHVNSWEKSGKAESMKEEILNWFQQMNNHKKTLLTEGYKNFINYIILAICIPT